MSKQHSSIISMRMPLYEQTTPRSIRKAHPHTIIFNPVCASFFSQSNRTRPSIPRKPPHYYATTPTAAKLEYSCTLPTLNKCSSIHRIAQQAPLWMLPATQNQQRHTLLGGTTSSIWDPFPANNNTRLAVTQSQLAATGVTPKHTSNRRPNTEFKLTELRNWGRKPI